MISSLRKTRAVPRRGRCSNPRTPMTALDCRDERGVEDSGPGGFWTTPKLRKKNVPLLS